MLALFHSLTHSLTHSLILTPFTYTHTHTQVQTRAADPIKSGELFASSSTYVLGKAEAEGEEEAEEEGAAAAAAAEEEKVHVAKKVRRGPPAKEADNFKF